jgi:site-specific recombinase XerD
MSNIPQRLQDESGSLPAFIREADPRVVELLPRLFTEEVSDNKHTRDAFAYDLWYLCNWCSKQGVTVAQVTCANMQSYATHLEQGFSNSTIGHRLGTARRFYEFLVANKVVEDNPARFVSRPNQGFRRLEVPIPVLSDPDSIPAFISNEGKRAVRAFCAYIASCGDREKQRDVSHCLVLFCRWCEGNNIGFGKLRPSTFVQYVERLTETYARTTIDNHIRYIRELLDRFVGKKILDHNPLNEAILSKPARSKIITQLPTCEQVEQLITHTSTERISGIRDRAIFAISFYALARSADIVALNVGDFFQKDGNWWFRFGPEKTREVPANSVVTNYVTAYLDAAGIIDQDERPMFRVSNRDGSGLNDKRMSRYSVRERFVVRRNQSGLPSFVNSVSIRGAGIREYLESGGTIEKVLAMTGMSMSGLARYLPETQETTVYEGDLDGLLHLLDEPASGPLAEFVRKSGIFRLSVQEKGEPD